MSAPSNTTNGFPPVLNPGEPFAYLPPEIAHQLHNFQYVACATLGMFVWELYYDLPSIYKLFIANRPTIPAVVYLVSRLGTLLFNAFTVQVEIVGGNCNGLYIAFGICWVFASACTSLLFFFRVRALYRDQNTVIGFFAFLWLCVVAGAVTVPLAGRNQVARFLPGESFCIDIGIYPQYAGAAIIIPAIYDSLVFIAISYRLFPSYEVNANATLRERAGLFFTGQGLPRLSKAVLQSGQQYYLMSVALNVLSLIFYFTPSIPIPYHVMVTLILINVINSMACKVYRDVRFGRISETTIVASSSGRTVSNLYPFRAAPRVRGDVFVNVDVTTTGAGSSVTGGRPGSMTGSTEMELADKSFKTDVEHFGQV